MRLGLGLMFLMIGLFGILFYLSGMHGHLTFRPHMLQDWIIWGIVFLKDLLEYNHFKVIVVPSPPPKAAPAPKPVEGEVASAPAEAMADKPETFTIGVTNVMFNVTNALFGRALKTKTGHIVTPAYWQQKDAVSHDEIPYYEQH